MEKAEIEREETESRDIYELKCLNHTDINMMRARRQFEREPYYLTAERKNKGGKQN